MSLLCAPAVRVLRLHAPSCECATHVVVLVFAHKFCHPASEFGLSVLQRRLVLLAERDSLHTGKCITGRAVRRRPRCNLFVNCRINAPHSGRELMVYSCLYLAAGRNLLQSLIAHHARHRHKQTIPITLLSTCTTACQRTQPPPAMQNTNARERASAHTHRW